MQHSDKEEISRREFEAVISPIWADIRNIRHTIEQMESRIPGRDDVKRVENLLNVAVGQWNQSNAGYVLQQQSLEKKVAFAQGAIALFAFLVGTGSLASVLYFILQR